jgi:hypothetical protein
MYVPLARMFFSYSTGHGISLFQLTNVEFCQISVLASYRILSALTLKLKQHRVSFNYHQSFAVSVSTVRVTAQATSQNAQRPAHNDGSEAAHCERVFNGHGRSHRCFRIGMALMSAAKTAAQRLGLQCATVGKIITENKQKEDHVQSRRSLNAVARKSFSCSRSSRAEQRARHLRHK